jgi:hypothetical protein
MMRLTIVVEDRLVIVDGDAHNVSDLSFIPEGVHAIQWYEYEGEVEYVDARGRPTHNERITDISPYQQALDAWQQAKEAFDNDTADQDA